jgi:integrase
LAYTGGHLGTFTAALKLGYEREPPLVLRIPKIEMLPEQNVREGILEHNSYLKLREVMLSAGYPRYCFLLVVGYHVGTREGELLSIQWPQVDLRANEIRLKAPTTKTKKPRIPPIYGDMKSWLEMAHADRDLKHPSCRWVFQKNGERMVFNWRTWHHLCAMAGVPGLLFHDLRRTALTNMIRAGISEKVAMEITGHRTRKTFERYHIVSDRDIRDVGVKMAKFLAESQSAGTLSGTLTGTPESKLLN